MKRIIQNLMTVSLVVLAITASSCGSNTSIVQSWKAPGPQAGLHKVVTVMMYKDVTVRRTAEDQMAQRLRGESAGIFDFGAERCDRVVEYVLAHLPN